MSTSSRSSSPHRCPECGHRVKRVLRSENDKRRWDADAWRRYRCGSCHWQGLLAVSQRRHRRLSVLGHEVVATPRLRRIALLLVLTSIIVWAGISALDFMMGPPAE